MRWDAILSRVPEMNRSTGVEVGVWDGRLSERLLNARPYLRLLMVDRWTPPREDDSYYSSGAAIALKPATDHENARKSAMVRTALAQAQGRAIICWADSYTAANALRESGPTPDWVFLDADHSFAGVMTDLGLWWPMVKAGGWIGGHDWDHPEQGQVKEAVREFFPTSEIEIDANRTWFVRKP